MKAFKTILGYAFLVFILLVIVSVIKPYWSKYWIAQEMDAFAKYATKNSLAETREVINQRMEEKGYGFEADDFVINKDANKTVTISLSYIDTMGLFGVTIKEVEFDIVKEAHEVKEYF